jgi:hypothetical protein
MTIRSLSLVGAVRARRATWFAFGGVVVMTTLLFLALTVKHAHASTFTVTNTNDSGAG